MKIIIDDKIPFIKGVLEPYAEVKYIGGAEMDAESVQDADALIIRTRTKCNKTLLENSSVKFIATATIGHDHIDKAYCKEKGIAWTNAPGCNSGSVQQYIASVLAVINCKTSVDLDTATLGIVGVGNVGSKVEKLCRSLGVNTLLCDPPRMEKEGGEFVAFDEVLEKADVITFHVPLDYDSKYPTFHMLNEHSIKKLKRKPIIINSSRGEVIKTEALKEGCKDGKISKIVLDVWENEPEIDRDLLDAVLIGTPHIAGYSADGKANGTSMSVQALSRYFDLPLKEWFPSDIPAAENSKDHIQGKTVYDLFLNTYEIEADSDKLKFDPDKFEWLRGNYYVRREFGFFKASLTKQGSDSELLLHNLGFKS